MSPKISIIVPVYNVENYLPACLNSIIEQTYEDYEVLLVDDGSTDDSLQLLELFRAKDKRFRLYQQEHRGVSAARNKGLKNAIGEYICFVDADDQIAPTYLEDLYQAIGGQADSSMGGFKKIDLLSQDVCEVVPKKKMETFEENLLGFYNATNTDWQRYLWNRMFKRSIILVNHFHFDEDIYYKEDGLFVIQYLCASNGLVGCVDKVLYFYFRNTSGAMSKTWHAFDDKLLTNLVAHKLMLEVIRQRSVSAVVLSTAINQAKSACNWILDLMFRTKSFKIHSLLTMESTMVSILGIRDYLSWRFSQVGKLFK